MSTPQSFGRVDHENNVYVNDGQERKIGQYPGVSPEDALAYFVRKYEDIAAQVRILEQRVANKVDSHGMKKMAAKLSDDLKEPAVVGDIADLRRRVSNLDEKIAVLVHEKHEASKEATAAALEQRNLIATKAEALANQDVAKIKWKSSSVEMNKLFDQWQDLQKTGPRVAKNEADAIWKRFSSARTRFESGKRAYFAGLDATNKAAKAKKTTLVENAEALAAKGSDDIGAYRKLLDEWKAAGRSIGKSDDALWVRFKAAGDAIFSKKTESAAVESAEFEKNLALKLEILKDAESIDPVKDLTAAKKSLLEIQKRWEKAGKVPKDKIRVTEDKLRAIESKVKQAEQDHWRKTDPAAIDRSNGVIAQLEDSIAKLDADLKKATDTKDAAKIKAATEALEARKSWLEVVKASMV